jgi:hypothetical protein
MFPMEYYANINLPYYGWFGRAFTTPQDARRYIAKMIRDSRKSRFPVRYRSRAYYVKPRLLRIDD